MISAEVVVTAAPVYRVDRLSTGFAGANRTLECAQNQTLRAQSGGIAGTQLLPALRAGWHFKLKAWAYCTPFVLEALVHFAQTL
jgi:hypothetical protein